MSTMRDAGESLRRLTRTGIAGALALAVTAIGVATAPDTTIEAAGLTFVVDSVADTADADPGDGICDTGPGVCTLRAAIEEANANSGHDVIEFSISGAGPHQLAPLTAYPRLDDPAGVTIDGYSEPGSSTNTLEHGTNASLMIELRGQGPSAFDGFDLRSADNVITGVAMFDFRRHIRIFGSEAHDNVIVGNFLGTNATATFAHTERITNANAVHLERGASANLIGMPGVENRNLLAGNADKGVAMFDSGTTLNLVQNNVFGLTPDGSARLTNWGHGVDINFNASHNLVGGWNAGEGNVVAGNELSGVEISHNVGTGSTTGNLVLNNLIGTSLDGGSAPLYAGNREFGVNFEGKPRCADSCTPDISGNQAIGNVIVGSNANVMFWKGANNNVASHNIIGVLADGSPAASSSATNWAVLIEAGAFSNRVEHNTIAGVKQGITVKPDNDFWSECLPSDTVCPEDAEFNTAGNTFSRNSIVDISNGLGIDLRSSGIVDGVGPSPSATDPSPDPLVNGAISFPTITSATTDELIATTCADCRIEVFVTPAPSCVDCWPDYGRGQQWIADGVADGDGDVVITFRSNAADPYVVLAGSEVAAHTTDPYGNTSEHSLRVVVSAGEIAPPPDPTTTVAGSSTTTSTPLPTTSTTVPIVSDPRPAAIRGSVTADVRAVRCSLLQNC